MCDFCHSCKRLIHFLQQVLPSLILIKSSDSLTKMSVFVCLCHIATADAARQSRTHDLD